MSTHSFTEAHVIHELKHFLPSQQALKDFIHHNSLHAFQHMKFYDAIFKASKIFGFQVHLQLSEYRELYKTGRIREDVLQMVILNKKGNTDQSGWLERLIKKDYDTKVSMIQNLISENLKHLSFEDLVHEETMNYMNNFVKIGSDDAKKRVDEIVQQKVDYVKANEKFAQEYPEMTAK